jgi:hypothetical protein
MAAKQTSQKTKSARVFGQARKPSEMFRAGLYARVSTHDQRTLPSQMRAMREYAAARGWTIALRTNSARTGNGSGPDGHVLFGTRLRSLCCDDLLQLTGEYGRTRWQFWIRSTRPTNPEQVTGTCFIGG